MMMQLGAEGVFVGSGIFKSGNPAERAAAIVKATTFYDDPDVLAKVSRGLGEAMVGINVEELPAAPARRARLVSVDANPRASSSSTTTGLSVRRLDGMRHEQSRCPATTFIVESCVATVTGSPIRSAVARCRRSRGS